MAHPQGENEWVFWPRVQILLLRELPAIWQERSLRITSWLASHKLALTDESIQSNTLLMLSLTTRAVTHMRENISREYLIERIEHVHAHLERTAAAHPDGPGNGQIQ